MTKSIRFLAAGKGAPPLLVPEAQVQVHARAGQVGAPLGHKGDRQILTQGDLLEALLVDGMAIGHFQGLGIAQIQLVLAGSPFAFTEFDRYAALVHMAADAGVDALFLGALQHVVVLDIPAEGFKVFVVFLAGCCKGILEEIVFEFRAALGRIAEFGQAVDLDFEHGARSNGDRLVGVVGLEVADDEGRTVEPGELAQGREIGNAVDIAIALFPVGEFVAFDDIHLHIHGQ